MPAFSFKCEFYFCFNKCSTADWVTLCLSTHYPSMHDTVIWAPSLSHRQRRGGGRRRSIASPHSWRQALFHHFYVSASLFWVSWGPHVTYVITRLGFMSFCSVLHVPSRPTSICIRTWGIRLLEPAVSQLRHRIPSLTYWRTGEGEEGGTEELGARGDKPLAFSYMWVHLHWLGSRLPPPFCDVITPFGICLYVFHASNYTETRIWYLVPDHIH